MPNFVFEVSNVKAKSGGLAVKYLGQRVQARDGTAGVCVGSYPCPRPTCRGHRLAVQWNDGIGTHPCSAEGMVQLADGTMQVVDFHHLPTDGNAAPH